MKITGQTRIPFSKYKGTRLRDIPNGFLQWVIEKLADSDFQEWVVAAREELERRSVDLNETKSLEEAADDFLKNAGYNPRKP